MSREPLNRNNFKGTGMSPAHVESFWDDYDQSVNQANTTENTAGQGLVGFINGANNPDTTLTFDESTRVVTLAPIGDTFDYWCAGVEYTSSGNTVTIPDEEGSHYVYFDQDVLKSTQIFLPTLITICPIVSIIVWDKVNSKCIGFGEERHGRVMTGESHLSFHLNPGTMFVRGCDLGFSSDPIGAPADDTHSKVYIAEGSIRDEDINITSVNSATPSGRWEQILGSNLTDDTAKLPVISLDGIDGNWRKWGNDSDRFAFQHNGGNTPPYFNEFTGGAWQLSPCTNRDFVVYYVCMWNDINYPVFLMMGQDLYDRQSDAEAATASSLSWGSYDPAELIVLHKLIFEYRTTYTNATHRCTLRQVESYNIAGTSKVALINSNQNHASLQNLTYENSGHTDFLRSPYFAASTDPTSDNDSIDTADIGRVFTVGEFWYNNSGDKLFFCKDATATAAVWKQITLV